MNDIITFIGDYVDQNSDIIIGDLENVLNEIPHSPLGYKNPVERFSELAAGTCG